MEVARVEDANEDGGNVGGGVLESVVGAGVCDGSDRGSGDIESRAGETCREGESRGTDGWSSRSGESLSSNMELRSGERRDSLEASDMIWSLMFSDVMRI